MATRKRIVSLISSATEILYLLGLGDQVVAISHECDYPAGIADKPRLTRSLVDSSASSRAIDDQVRSLAVAQAALYTIDTEQLAALAPDLIITQAQCDVCAVRYEDVVQAVSDSPALGHAQILAINPISLPDVLVDIGKIGSAADSDQAAQSVIAQLSARVEAVRAKTSLVAPDDVSRVACLEWVDPPMLAANWMPQLIEWAGGQPGLTIAGQHSSYADWQAILNYDPQVIVVMPCGFDLARSIVEAQSLPLRSGWTDLAAVRDSRVFAADGNAYFNRSGPRLVDSLEILAHLFHPTIFAPPLAPLQNAWRRLQTRASALVPEEL